jgi:tetratricopeptide (TPR) repeat protein
MLTSVIVFAALCAPAVQEEEILHPGTGPHTRPVVIAEGKARQFFNQGLNFMYAFNHGEAKRSFRAAANYDPTSAMAWWGLAMANGPHINNMAVDPAEEKEAVESLQSAMKHIGKARPADQALIRATLVRFKHPQPKDRGPLNAAFANAMRKVWKQYPNDDDIGALFAESMMDLRPWDLWQPGGIPQPGTREVVATLERVIKLNKDNPLGLHLYIHAVEASLQPEKAKWAADRLRQLQPGLGHNVHMPSHIDVRVGDWEKAIVANEKAIEADRIYRAKRPNQFIYRIYMAHNGHMLALAAMMLGQGEKATKAIDEMCAAMPEDFKKTAAPFVDGFFAMPFEVRKRFGKWDDVLALPDLPEYFPLSRALRHEARSVAYAAKGMPKEARFEQAQFYAAKSKVPQAGTFGNNRAHDILRVAQGLMNGEILVAEGKIDRAVAELRMAIRHEDKLRYSEPPDWIQPVRHTLGAVLSKYGRHAEAVRVYREDLQRLPNNGWSTFGLSSSLRALGKTSEADILLAKFNKLWANADTPITSSCLCVPGG